MKRVRVGVAVVLASVMLCVGWPATAGSLEELNAARAAFTRKDYVTVERSANAAIEAGDLKGDELAGAYFLRGYTRAMSQKFDDTIGDFTEALKHTAVGGTPWAAILHARFLTYCDLNRWREAAGDFVALAKERPNAARSQRYHTLFRLVWELERKDDPAAFDVLKAMREISYKSNEPGYNMDYMTQIFVRLLAERGDDMVAMLELSKIRTADFLVEARVDRRYAPLWSKKDFDAVADPKEMAARELAHVAELAKQHPNMSLVMMRHVRALRQAGDGGKAIEVAREALANPELTSAQPERIIEDKLWLRNELVYALKDLGRIDEMLAEMQPVLKLDEAKHGAMVNQLINFGQIMVEAGRAEEGMKTAQRGWNAASPLGKMFIHMVEVCATANTDKAAAEKALSLLKQGQADNYGAMTTALLCMDRTDAAADLLKKRLSLPQERARVLTAVQTYQPPPFVMPLRKTLMERYTKAVARSDVQAAIKKHGRVESFPFASTYWGNL